MRPLPALVALLLPLPLAAQAADYVVLAAFAAEDPFDAAARVLAAHHGAAIVRFDPADLAPVRAALAQATPRHVALVLRPEQLEFGLQRRFLQLASEVDADPFVDFAFGYITGRTAEDAVALAQRGVARRPEPVDGGVASVAGGVDRSAALPMPHPLRRTRLDGLRLLCAGEQAFPERGRDVGFLQAQLPKLKGRDAVTFVGHGYPREVVGGPTFAELAGLELPGAVVLNVACYTGVTSRWFEEDWRQGVVRGREVPLDESFCLALLRTGVVGYTAYVCPRPAGPELDTDLAALVADGVSLGEARRRDYDKTVLGFLGFGEPRLQLAPVADGDRLAPGRDSVRDLMLEYATGGVLFGDPACVPFVAREDDAPVAIEVAAAAGGIVVKARTSLQGLFLHCADPTAMWGGTMAMRVYARVPLGAAHVADVVVDELTIGGKPVPSRVLWAVEHDRGARFLQLRVNFPRDERVRGGLRLSARVQTTDDAAQGRERGGEVKRRPVASADVRSRELQPFLLERAEAREVAREVLQQALDASAFLLGDAGVAAGILEAFAARGSEGFRAVCALLDVGHVHFRTWELLRATWRPGDERHLLALASGDDLPNHASWVVLEGLGAADTPVVRAFLQQRLADEQDAGLWMSAAKALAHLGVREVIPLLGERVREFRPEWAGVQPFLLAALAELGGAEAVQELEAIGRDARCKEQDAAQVLQRLDRLDAAAAQRVRQARGGGR